jgi:arylsulfatase A-like enzyme
MAATGDRVPCVFIENGFIADYDPTAPIEVNYRQNFAGEPTGKSHPELLYNLKPSPNHGHDQSIVNGISRIGFMKGGGKALWKDENIADSITSHAIDFIRRNHEEPFFMYLCTNDIHVPRFPHPRFRGKTDMGHRGDAIVQFDWTIGEVMKTLKELNIDKNTIIILTSDNGPVVDDGYDDEAVARLGSHKPSGPLRGNKYSSFEGGTRVPFIVSWPHGINKAKDSEALVSQIDLFASFAQMLNARLPKGSCPDSRKHWDALVGKDSKGCEYVVEQNLWNVLSIRTNDWKYIEPSNGASYMKLTDIETGNSPLPQLYDMNHEGEKVNLAEEHPDIVENLKGIL